MGPSWLESELDSRGGQSTAVLQGIATGVSRGHGQAPKQ